MRFTHASRKVEVEDGGDRTSFSKFLRGSEEEKERGETEVELCGKKKEKKRREEFRWINRRRMAPFGICSMPVHELHSIRDHHASVNSRMEAKREGKPKRILSPFFSNSSLDSARWNLSIEKNSSSSSSSFLRSLAVTFDRKLVRIFTLDLVTKQQRKETLVTLVSRFVITSGQLSLSAGQVLFQSSSFPYLVLYEFFHI